MANQPSKIHLAMIDALKANPGGLGEAELRHLLGLGTGDQLHFGKRRRELKQWFVIEKKQLESRTVYIYKGKRDKPLNDGDVDSTTRAAVLRSAHGRCGMCGRTIEKHGVALRVDHKIPRAWGGSSSDIENLWAICEECNHGKQAHFASQDQALMQKVMSFKSVHVRLGETLKSNLGKPVPSYLLAFVADSDDWKKRTRDLRYLGWKFSTQRRKIDGKSRAFYTLHQFKPWPDNPTKVIQEYERDRAKKNRLAKSKAEQQLRGGSDTDE